MVNYYVNDILRFKTEVDFDTIELIAYKPTETKTAVKIGNIKKRLEAEAIMNRLKNGI
jgi:hypothetical protein